MAYPDKNEMPDLSRRAFINGQTVAFEPNDTILEAARRAGIFIPTLCELAALNHRPGTCRVCLVEVELPQGGREIVTSCETKIEPGMRIRTRTAEVRRRQKMQVELLMADHDENCSSCKRHGKCGLQDAALWTGADRLGLSQLYQIRGRIGRSNRTSYAFLMYKRDKMLKEDAEKRLQAIREFTELGSGIKIAMRDLEIRGAGNILGAEQHGHMEAVGYDLYCKMLNEAVIALKGGQEEEETFETVVDCDIDAFIPDGYIKNEYLKLDVYKRISAIETDDEYMDMQDELIDRFGDIPKSVDNLLRVAELKALAHRAYVTEVDINTQEIRIELYPKAKLDVTKIPALIAEYKTALRFAQGGEKPVLFYQEKGKKNKNCEPMIEKAKEILGKLGELAESRK